MPDLINVITTTLNAWSKEIFDLVLNQNKLLFCFANMGKYLNMDGLGKNDNLLPIKRVGGITFLKGGKAVEEDVSILSTQNAGAVDYNETLDTAETQVLNHAVFQWKSLYTNPVWYRLAEKVNQDSGVTQKFKEIDALKQNATSTLVNLLGEQLFNDPLTNPKGFGGIPYLITDDGNTTGANAVGGISTAVYPNWANQFEAIAANPTPDDLRQGMGRLWRKLRLGADVIVTTSALYDLYEASLISQVQVGSFKQLQDSWFEYLTFHKAAVIYDDNCPENRMYFLNFKAMTLNILGDDLVTVPETPEHPAGTQQYMWPIITDGNLSVRSRRDLGVLVVMPPAQVFTVTGASVASGGTGYAASDVLTVPGGSPNATITVASVNGSGAITGVSVATGGAYASVLSGAQPVLGGTGSGATLSLVMA